MREKKFLGNIWTLPRNLLNNLSLYFNDLATESLKIFFTQYKCDSPYTEICIWRNFTVFRLARTKYKRIKKSISRIIKILIKFREEELFNVMCNKQSNLITKLNSVEVKNRFKYKAYVIVHKKKKELRDKIQRL